MCRGEGEVQDVDFLFKKYSLATITNFWIKNKGMTKKKVGKVIRRALLSFCWLSISRNITERVTYYVFK